MAQSLVFLDYTFLFDPSATFFHLYEFEGRFSKFLASEGFEAEVLKSIEGSLAKRILYITKKPLIAGIEPKNTPGRPPSLKTEIDKMRIPVYRKPAREFMGKK